MRSQLSQEDSMSASFRSRPCDLLLSIQQQGQTIARAIFISILSGIVHRSFVMANNQEYRVLTVLQTASNKKQDLNSRTDPSNAVDKFRVGWPSRGIFRRWQRRMKRGGALCLTSLIVSERHLSHTRFKTRGSSGETFGFVARQGY